MSVLSDSIADDVTRKLMRYYHQNRLRLAYPITGPQLRAQMRSLAESLETVNPLNLMDPGPLKTNLHPTHARYIAMQMLQGFVEAEKSERLAFEETLKPGYIADPPVMS